MNTLAQGVAMNPIQSIIVAIRDDLSVLEAGKAWRSDIVAAVRGRLDALQAVTDSSLVATLEAREAPDLAKELTAWLDANVSRCGHGYISITCGQCFAGWLPR